MLKKIAIYFVLGFMLLFATASHVAVLAQESCTFTLGTGSPVWLLSTPIGGHRVAQIFPNQSYPILREGVINDSAPAYELLVDGTTRGWIEVITIGEERGNCNVNPIQSLSISEFAEICEATIVEPAMLFRDSRLTQFFGEADEELNPIGQTFITVSPTSISASIYSGHAGPFQGVLASRNLQFDANCSLRPFVGLVTATALNGARLWTNPHVLMGKVITDVPAGTVFDVMTGPIASVISDNGETKGDWFLVRHAEYGTGWIWGGFLELSEPFPPEALDSGTTTGVVPVWLAPNTGTPIDELPAGLTVNILRISESWYFIATSAGENLGWAQAEQIALDSSRADEITSRPEPIGTGIVSGNARLWSEPDVKQGTPVGELAEGTEVNLLEGPVDGFIRADSDVLGSWYRVETQDGSVSGWLWAGRIEIKS